MISLLVNVAVLVIIVLALWFILSKAPIPEGAKPMVQIVAVVVVAVVCIILLLQLPHSTLLR